MLLALLANCMKQFETLTENQFEHVEPLETYNLMKTLFVESCPSLLPQSEPANPAIEISKEPKGKYTCKGLDSCWHAHSVG
jgi:hypothetical protein